MSATPGGDDVVPTQQSDKNNDYERMSIKDLRVLLTLRGYDCSQCLEKQDLVAAARKLDATDFDEEAHKIFRQLNLPSSSPSRYSNLDAIWKEDGNGGGTVYVGNYRAASERRTLRERNIVAIVNCQDETSQNYFENDPELSYYRFLVSSLSMRVTRQSGNANMSPMREGFQQLFAFIQQHVERGDSVLIHCLAGAHRAGATGTAWLMDKTRKPVAEALVLAKACRPIISPFGRLLECLHLFQIELEGLDSNEEPSTDDS